MRLDMRAAALQYRTPPPAGEPSMLQCSKPALQQQLHVACRRVGVLEEQAWPAQQASLAATPLAGSDRGTRRMQRRERQP